MKRLASLALAVPLLAAPALVAGGAALADSRGNNAGSGLSPQNYLTGNDRVGGGRYLSDYYAYGGAVVPGGYPARAPYGYYGRPLRPYGDPYAPAGYYRYR